MLALSIRYRLFTLVAIVAAIYTSEFVSSHEGEKEASTATKNSSKAIYDSQAFDQPRLSPEETVATTKLPEGFRMQVASKSPDIQQPIGMCWDSRGRLWVVENYTYAERELNFDDELRDRILIFEDTDGDGLLDKRKVFWDQGNRLTSVEIGYGGVWAMAAPNLLFIPDRDRDDVPDGEPQVILDGFEHQAIRHNLANGLRWGPDGWLYGRHGIQAVSKVGPPGSSELERLRFSCSIWRWHPHRKKLEVVCHGTTNAWGHDWDRHGQLFFINTVIGHLWHALPGAHLQRMSGDDLDPEVYELMPQVADHLHFDSGNEVWSDIRNLGVTPTTDALGGGHAHTGMMIYQDDRWPAAYRDRVFTLNFHGRRLNVERLDRHGAGFVGRHEPDMIRFSDPWFRGIELSSGPDGNVWVLDWSDIGECHENDGVHRNSGTIYRVAYGSQNSGSVTSDLRSLSNDELINKISSANSWLVRQTRLILSERTNENQLSNIELNKIIDIARRDANPLHRLRALWILQTCGHDKPDLLIELLQDENEHVRIHAMNGLVDSSRDRSDVTGVLLAMVAKEKSELVLLHGASALQKIDGVHWWSIMRELCRRSDLADDRDYPLMLWYAMKDKLTTKPSAGIPLLAEFYGKKTVNASTTADPNPTTKVPFQKLVHFSSRLLASRIQRDPNALAMLVATATEGSADMQADVIIGMHLGLNGRHRAQAPTDWDRFVQKAKEHPDVEVRESLLSLQTLFGDGVAAEQLAQIVLDNKAHAEARRGALESLTESRIANTKELAYKVLRHQTMTREALTTILRLGNEEDAKNMMELYPDKQVFRAGVPEVLLSGLAGRREYLPILFGAIENKRLAPSLVDASLLRQMQMLDDPTINEKLAKHWPQTKLLGRERMTQIRDLESRLTSDVLAHAQLGKGRTVWDKLCASCHRMYGQGGLIGPELTGAQRTNLRYLTENILDPSATVAENYRISLILLEDGTLVSGVPVSEDESTITVQTPKERIAIEKSNIEERKASTQSLMPEGLLDALSDEARRDLIGYLMSTRQVEPE